MTKKQLVDETSKRTGLTQKEVLYCLNQVLETATDAIVKGEDITIQGFGSFLIKNIKERNLRNPKTGVAFTAPPKKVLKFKPSKGLVIK